MRDRRMGVRLITEVLDVLDRHGYARGDDGHADRAIFLIRDLAHIYEGSQDHPFGPNVNQPPPQAEPVPPTPGTIPVPLGEVRNLLCALDIAADYNQDRAELYARLRRPILPDLRVAPTGKRRPMTAFTPS